MARWEDLDLNFTAHPVTGDLTILEDADAVKRSVRNKMQMIFEPNIYRMESSGGSYSRWKQL